MEGGVANARRGDGVDTGGVGVGGGEGVEGAEGGGELEVGGVKARVWLNKTRFCYAFPSATPTVFSPAAGQYTLAPRLISCR